MQIFQLFSPLSSNLTMNSNRISSAILHQTIDKYNEHIKDLSESMKGLYRRQIRIYLEYCVEKDVDYNTTTNGDATLLMQYFKYCVDNKPPGKKSRDNIIGGLARFFEMFGKTNALNPMENNTIIAILDPLRQSDDNPDRPTVKATTSGIPNVSRDELSMPFATKKKTPIVPSKRVLAIDSSSDDEFVVKDQGPGPGPVKKQKLSIFSSPVASETSHPMPMNSKSTKSPKPVLDKTASSPAHKIGPVRDKNAKMSLPSVPLVKKTKKVETKKVSIVQKQQLEANKKRKAEMKEKIRLATESSKRKRMSTHKILIDKGELELAKLLNQL